jgi:hypothetical protein
MKYFISSLGFWSKSVTSILNKNILLLKKKMNVAMCMSIKQIGIYLLIVIYGSIWLHIQKAQKFGTNYNIINDLTAEHFKKEANLLQIL